MAKQACVAGSTNPTKTPALFFARHCYLSTLIWSLLWKPPVMQEASGSFRGVIECGLLSGLHVRHFDKHLSGMVARFSKSRTVT